MVLLQRLSQSVLKYSGNRKRVEGIEEVKARLWPTMKTLKEIDC